MHPNTRGQHANDSQTPKFAFTPHQPAMAPRKNSQSTAAELSLVQLQKCFVNLPSTLVNILLNVDTVGRASWR